MRRRGRWLAVSRKRERRKGSRAKLRRLAGEPVFRLPEPVFTEMEVRELERQLEGSGFELAGIELCDDPACLDHDNQDGE
jgi:hypothetical protein